MKKKAIYILLLILILLSIYFGFFYRSFDIEHYSFSISDTSNIDKIVITDSSNKVELTKPSDEWVVNKNYHANQALIKQLIRIFNNLEINVLVPDKQVDSTINCLQKQGVGLKFYRNDRLKYSYWIGRYDETSNSTLLMNDDKVVAFVTSPGLTKNIRKFLETDNVFWRDRLIFSLNPAQILSVELKDNLNKENSFSIEKKFDKYLLYNNKHAKIEFKEESLLRYLSYFSNINFESLDKELSPAQQDSLLKQKPIYTLIVKSQLGQATQLNLFPKKSDKNNKEQDLNYVYGNINNEKLVLMISYFQVDPVLKGIGYFMNK
jgi:hypothetical protein